MRENDFEGDFIAVEGPDASGTTTQVKLLGEKKRFQTTKEPTELKSGKMVSEMISSDKFSAEAVALMFAADRMVHLEKEIIPRLEKGETVVTDRYFLSSLVYQNVMGLESQRIRSLNRRALRPDLTVYIDVDVDDVLSRMEKRKENDGSVFEEKQFQEKVIKNYRDLADQESHVKAVNGSSSIESVHQNIMEVVDSELQS